MFAPPYTDHSCVSEKHVFTANRDILNRQIRNFVHTEKPSEANQENEKKRELLEI